MKIYNTEIGAILAHNNQLKLINLASWDLLFEREDVLAYLNSLHLVGEPISQEDFAKLIILKPIQSQEVWAAGVTYYRSRSARIEESQGGGSFYDKVYSADRPELFFKSTSERTSGPGETICIRRDSNWDVPEPELTLAINSNGKIIGYTIGNDVSSRSIEGENPLYLPQAKTYEKSAALGPCILLSDRPLQPSTKIRLTIHRNSLPVFDESITLTQMKRSNKELAEFLYRECKFPKGCFLMTGTGIVPPNDFTLKANDFVDISIDQIGRLTNKVGYNDFTN